MNTTIFFNLKIYMTYFIFLFIKLSREAAKFEFLPPNLSSVASDNESNISLYGSAEPPRESAVIIVTRLVR